MTSILIFTAAIPIAIKCVPKVVNMIRTLRRAKPPVETNLTQHIRGSTIVLTNCEVHLDRTLVSAGARDSPSG